MPSHHTYACDGLQWDTSNILAASAGAPSGIEGWAKQSMATPMCGSFMHLHVGIRAEGLPAPEDIGIHHLAVETWDRPLDEVRTRLLACTSRESRPQASYYDMLGVLQCTAMYHV